MAGALRKSPVSARVMLAAAVIVAATCLGGCTTKSPVQTLASVQLGMSPDQVEEKLGGPTNSTRAETREWNRYNGGVYVAFSRPNSASPFGATYVVQTEGDYRSQFAIGATAEKVKTALGPKASSADTGTALRLEGEGGTITEFLMEKGQLQMIGLRAIDAQVDSRTTLADWPAITVGGVGLGLTTEQVRQLVGSPPLQAEVGRWVIWYYPKTDLTVAFAQPELGQGGGRSVYLASKTAGYNAQFPRDAGIDDIRHCLGIAGGGSTIALEDETGAKLELRFSNAKLTMAEATDTRQMADFPGSPKNAVLKEAVGEFRIAGVALFDQASRVEDLLGKPDAVMDGHTSQTWEYSSRGLSINLSHTSDSEPWSVWMIILRSGEYSGRIRVGMPEKELEDFLGPVEVLNSFDASGMPEIRVLDSSGSTLDIQVSDGCVESIVLTIHTEP